MILLGLAGVVMFVAVGHNGLRLASRDGRAWENPQTGREGEVYHSLAFGAGRCVAVGRFGGDNLLAVTTDGAKWQSQNLGARYSRYVASVSFAQGAFLALGGEPGTVGASSPFLLRTQDGVAWSDYQSISGKNILRRMTFGAGKYVGVGDRGRRATSPDGKEWTDLPNTRAVDTLIDVAFGNGVFVGVGLHGLRMTSPDGLNWERRFPGEEGEHLNSVLWTGKQFTAIGLGATYFSPDGLKWERKPNRNAPLAAAYGEGRYVGCAWKGRLLHSPDAVTWTDGYRAPHHVEAVGYGALPNTR